MTGLMKDAMTTHRLATALVVAAALAATPAACSHRDVAPPHTTEFGFGPRASDAGMYRATVEPAGTIRVGALHGWTLRLEDASGGPVTSARITVDGGMPQHGHGLPTRPRVTAELGDGSYQVEGMRFNMGGWWVVTFRVHGPPGDDQVTFNLDL
jgi:hypothetical protein